MSENYRDTIVRTVKDMLAADGHEDLGKFITPANISYDELYSGNYGGDDSIGISIDIPTDSYMDLRKNDGVKNAEELLLQLFSEAYSGRSNIAFVKIRPNSSVHFTLFDSGEYSGWKNGYFRMFISHVSKHKKEASSLKKYLEDYGITSFVAHEDIKPSREWIREIEKALNSMDCMVAIMYDEFPTSNWCDQEVGIALGRNVTVIPILINNNPYGFIGEYQGIKAKGIKPSEIAESVFNVICDNPNTRYKYLKVLTSLFLQSEDKKTAEKWWELISKIDKLSVDVWSTISQNITNNKFLMKQNGIIDKINDQLTANSLPIIRKKDEIISISDEDLPF